jgi:hypothetical protein
LRELKLLVDHRDDLVAERRRCQQRLRWHLHELDPSLAVPLGALDRSIWLDRLGRRLARGEQTMQDGSSPRLEASSGKHQRHRLDRGGNRQLNCALHRIAITQGRVHAPARLSRAQAERGQRAVVRESAASNDSWRAPSTPRSRRSQH